VTSLTLTAALHAAIIATGSHSYAEAHRTTTETGRPLVVLVGADWCPACQVMKNSTMPTVAQGGVLNKVSFAVVNTDQESTIAQQIMTPGVIPQLVMYRKTIDGWKRDALVGAHSSQEIEAFLLGGLEAPTALLGQK
jgi:thioredoxin-like negative regulator of GroEL